MKMQTVTRYFADDGREFETREEAARNDVFVAVYADAKADGWSDENADMIADYVSQRFEHFVGVLAVANDQGHFAFKRSLIAGQAILDRIDGDPTGLENSEPIKANHGA